MEKINVKELNDNVFETIGKEWMLVCAGNKDKFNMMTASWDGSGTSRWLWYLSVRNATPTASSRRMNS